MDVTQIEKIISTFGFPVVVCGALFWFILKQQEKQEKSEERHQQETNALREAISKLEIAITKLYEKLGGN